MRTPIAFVITGSLLLLGAVPAVAGQEADASGRSPIPSVGCGSSTIESGTFLDEAMDVVGFTRRWAAYVPQAHDGANPMPVWLYLHPSGGNRKTVAQALQPVAEELGFVAVVPQARGGGWMMPADGTELDLSAQIPDVSFAEQVLDQVGDELCVDLARSYVIGNSMGAGGAMMLACVSADRFAAVVPIAGVVDLGEACGSDRAMPTMAIHGTMDGLQPFAGGLGERDEQAPSLIQALKAPSVPVRVAGIAARNGCEPGALVETVSDLVEQHSWPCPAGA